MIVSVYTTASADVGFLSGNQFSVSSIQGQVTVYCADGSSAVYTCRDNALDPVSYDYFAGPSGVAADEITLTSVRSDGSVRETTGGYDASAGHSANAFNLWISTIFQRPLLRAGVNKVNYVLGNAGKEVSQGIFVVNVGAGAPRTCPATHYNSADKSDCESQYTVCQRYFEQYQNCH
jgi:hypothetical protein